MNRSEIEALYRKHGPMVLRRARVLLGEEQAARDALHEVFVRVLRNESQFRGESSPTTWLYRITTNYCLNLIRDGARRTELLADRVEHPLNDTMPEQRIAIAEVLHCLTEELYAIAVYYYVDQMNQDEIAALLGISRRTVGNRLEEVRTLTRSFAARSTEEP